MVFFLFINMNFYGIAVGRTTKTSKSNNLYRLVISSQATKVIEKSSMWNFNNVKSNSKNGNKRFVWVLAHVRLTGNKLADKYAKTALKWWYILVKSKVGKAEIKLRKKIQNIWQDKWNRQQMKKVFFFFFLELAQLLDWGTGNRIIE